MTSPNLFWPGGARLAVSFSLMFEAGGQPISGAGGVIPDPIGGGMPDLPTNAFSNMAFTREFRACWICSTSTRSKSAPS